MLSLNFFAHWPTGEPLFNEGLGLTIDSVENPELERSATAIDAALERLAPGHDYLVYGKVVPLTGYLEVQRVLPDFIMAWVRALASKGVCPTILGDADPRLLKAMAKIRSMPLDRPLVVEDLAREVGLSVVHLNRLAMKHTGLTLHLYWEQRRAEYVRRCLLTRGTQIKQVAVSLGFGALGHFSRWFRNIHGVSPRAFRDKGGIGE